MDYSAPIAEQLFVLEAISEIDNLLALPAYADVDRDIVPTILDAGGRLAAELFAQVQTGQRQLWPPGRRFTAATSRAAPQKLHPRKRPGRALGRR